MLICLLYWIFLVLFSYFVDLFSIFKTNYNLRICPKWSLHWLMDWSSQNFHNIGLSIQFVNSTTASGNQYLLICVDNPNSQSLTCMLAKPLHLYCKNFNYLSTYWTSLCWPYCEMFGKINKNEKNEKWMMKDETFLMFANFDLGILRPSAAQVLRHTTIQQY